MAPLFPPNEDKQDLDRIDDPFVLVDLIKGCTYPPSL